MRSFGLLCDETNDVPNKEQLIVFVKFVNPTTAKLNTKFLAASDLIEKSTLANASTITTVIPQQLEESGGETLFVQKCVWWGNNADACDSVTYLEQVENILYQLWSFFWPFSKEVNCLCKSCAKSEAVESLSTRAKDQNKNSKGMQNSVLVLHALFVNYFVLVTW